MNAKRAIAAARRRSELLVLRCYCENADCSVRQVKVRVKDLDGDKRLGQIPKCPLCSAPMNLHDALTFAEEDRHELRNARGSVAVQMYERDHERGGIVATPASVFTDDRLPPTPVGWWDKR